MPNAIVSSDLKNLILHIRGRTVMLDSDLAKLYSVTTGNLNKAVKRNQERFPDDFMFQLSKEELENLMFQNGRSRWGGVRKLPFVFTENGVAMLSSVLNSERAIQVNIQIMRAFVRMRNIVSENKDLMKTIQNIERRLDIHDRQIQVAFAALKSILQPPALRQEREYSPNENKKMGFGKKVK